ncbi:hypothetical protein BKA80DRAFT_6176 [Phyllosticta citrichinensis]
MVHCFAVSLGSGLRMSCLAQPYNYFGFAGQPLECDSEAGSSSRLHVIQLSRSDGAQRIQAFIPCMRFGATPSLLISLSSTPPTAESCPPAWRYQVAANLLREFVLETRFGKVTV